MENWIKSIESLQYVNRSPFLHRAVPLKIQVPSGKDKEGEHLAIWMGCKRKICRLNWETMAGVEWKWNGNAGYLPNWPQNPPRSFVFPEIDCPGGVYRGSKNFSERMSKWMVSFLELLKLLSPFEIKQLLSDVLLQHHCTTSWAHVQPPVPHHEFPNRSKKNTHQAGHVFHLPDVPLDEPHGWRIP